MNVYPYELDDLSFNNVSMNVAVNCAACHRRFDATGGGDGTFSQSSTGELRRVLPQLLSLDATSRERLSGDLATAKATGDLATAIETLNETLGTRLQQSSARERRMEIWALVSILIGLIALFRSGGVPESESDLEDRIDRIERQVEQRQVEPPRRKIGRNEACPCSSGRKFKKCHGSSVP